MNENLTKLQHHNTMEAIKRGDKETTDGLMEIANGLFQRGEPSMTDREFHECEVAYQAQFGVTFKSGQRQEPVTPHDRQANCPHDFPFLANWLGKSNSVIELHAWLLQHGIHHDASLTTPVPMAISPKWDGMAIIVTYTRYGIVKKALTRGEDGKGVDVTRHFANEQHFKTADGQVDFESEFGVKYEVVMSWTAMEALGIELGRAFSNPRNTVAGILSSDDSSKSRKYLTFAPLDIEWMGADEQASRADRLSYLQMLFCGTEDEPAIFNFDFGLPQFHWWVIGETGSPFDDALTLYSNIQQFRETTDYMLDGVVYELIDPATIEHLGGRSMVEPAYVTAVKFPSMVGRTKAVSMDYDMGTTGRITPVVNYEPITLEGRTFSRTSLSNFLRFDALQLAPGTPILIEIRGDIIAWVTRDGDDPEGAVPFVEPDGLDFTYNEHEQRVFASVAAPLENQCERMIMKCGVKGVRIETIRKLVEGGVLTKLSDVWSFIDRSEQAMAIPGLGEGSVNVIIDAIERVRKEGLWDWQILASVNILNVGRTLSKSALKHITLRDLVENSATPSPELTALMISAIGPERGPTLLAHVHAKTPELLDLMDCPSLPPYKCSKTAADVLTTGQKFKVVVTGDLAYWDREVFRDYIETLGHKMVSSISKKTDLLITNTPTSGTKKNREAETLGVRIVNEETAIELMGLVAPEKKVGYTPGMPDAVQRQGTLDEM